MRNKLRTFIDGDTKLNSKLFDYFIQLMILISFIVFSIETLPHNSNHTIKILSISEIICLSIFSIEYVLRVYVAEKPLKYIFSFYGIIDLLAIFPFYFKALIDMRVLRFFRIFRIFRILKLVRYIRALHRFQIAINIVKEEIVLFLIATLILIFLSATGIYFFENEVQPNSFSSIYHSLWWAITTLTTVGYGDVYPVTIGGKIFTFFVLIIGIGVVTVPTGLVATALTKARNLEEENKKSI
jgi:voltage-gated potassium channel